MSDPNKISDYPEHVSILHVGHAVMVIEGRCEDVTDEDIQNAWRYLYRSGAYMHLQGSLQSAILWKAMQDANDDAPTEHDGPARWEQVKELPSDDDC
jgi:hypothetical protein